MRLAHAIICLMAPMAGCVPLKQYNVTGGRQYDNFGYVDHLHCGLLQVGPSNVPKNFKVVTADSYAIAPGGHRYGIRIEPHDYDLRPDKDPRVPYVRDRVYLVDANGKRLDRDWVDGQWNFHFVMETPTGRDVRDFNMRLWTFKYNPVVHGPPN